MPYLMSFPTPIGMGSLALLSWIGFHKLGTKVKFGLNHSICWIFWPIIAIFWRPSTLRFSQQKSSISAENISLFEVTTCFLFWCWWPFFWEVVHVGSLPHNALWSPSTPIRNTDIDRNAKSTTTESFLLFHPCTTPWAPCYHTHCSSHWTHWLSLLFLRSLSQCRLRLCLCLWCRISYVKC